MENSLLMRTEASYSLNFLVYIQNIFLNKISINEQEYKFPLFSSKYMVIFDEEFEFAFKGLWDEIVQKISGNPKKDLEIFHEQGDLFYKRLFMENDDSLNGFNEVYQSFKVWWDSLVGRFSVERFSDEKGHKLYMQLSNAITKSGNEPLKELNISLVYDEFPLGNLDETPYFAVVPIKDFYFKTKN